VFAVHRAGRVNWQQVAGDRDVRSQPHGLLAVNGLPGCSDQEQRHRPAHAEIL
jgi:hypothetical protein